MYCRLDIVWVCYIQDSLKASTWEKRGKGVRRRAALTSAIPNNWQSFLRVNENKTELFHLLAEQVATIDVEGKEVYSTMGSQVLCTSGREDMTELEPCSHEEADTRLMLHVSDAAHRGHRAIMVRTVYIDVVVIILSDILNTPVSEL